MKIHAMIETAVGVQNVYQIAGYSKRVDAITIGGQDLTADMGIEKTKDNAGIDYARKQIIMAAKANNGDIFAAEKLKALGVHASETAWVGRDIDHVISNNSSIDDLYEQIKNLVSGHLVAMAA